MLLLFFGTFFLTKISGSIGFETTIDYEMYRKALDPVMCEKQLESLVDPTKRLFKEANANIPSNVFPRGQIKFIGNFEKCLSITDEVTGAKVNGKYCQMSTNFPNNFQLVHMSNETSMEEKRYAGRRNTFKMYVEYGCDNVSTLPGNTIKVKIDICIPATCTTKQALDWAFNKSVTFDGSFVPGVSYEESFCRLAGDKPLTIAEIVGIVIFSLILLMNIVSTAYDIYWRVINKKSKPNPTYSSFSVYTNTQRLVSCSSPADTVECADGMRVISLLWIIMYHQTLMYCDIDDPYMNTHFKFDDFEYFTLSGKNAVDTFFVLGGLFLVYTTASRFTRDSFLKNLHLFVLRRLIRLWPLMGAWVLISSSFLARVADGPNWNSVARIANGCRLNWWPIMLFIQNQVKFCSVNTSICLGHFWYISVDVQLYIVSPLVLVWLFGCRRAALVTLTLAVLLSVASSAAFSFAGNFSYGGHYPDAQASLREKVLYDGQYNAMYYRNSLARAAPFMIGMMAGYLLHCYRGLKMHFRKLRLYQCWVMSLLVICGCVYAHKAFRETDLAQIWHNLMNGFSRAVWGSAIAWIIVACHHGYGGPVNWFLSLKLWKLPSKLSYAMYLVHFTMIFINKGVKTYEDVDAHTNILSLPLLFAQSFLAAFVLTVTVELPVQNLQRIFLDDKLKCGNSQDNSLKTTTTTAVPT